MYWVSIARPSIDHDRNIHSSGHPSRGHSNFLEAEQRLGNTRTRAECVTTDVQGPKPYPLCNFCTKRVIGDRCVNDSRGFQHLLKHICHALPVFATLLL